MSENAAIYVTVAGDRLRIILPGDGWTSDEAKLAKTVTGMAPITVEDNLMLMDPDAWDAVLRVSYLRAGKEFPTAEIAKTDLLELMNAVTAALTEAAKDLPPTPASANGSPALEDESKNEPSADQSSEKTTSETSGTPA